MEETKTIEPNKEITTNASIEELQKKLQALEGQLTKTVSAPDAALEVKVTPKRQEDVTQSNNISNTTDSHHSTDSINQSERVETKELSKKEQIEKGLSDLQTYLTDLESKTNKSYEETFEDAQKRTATESTLSILQSKIDELSSKVKKNAEGIQSPDDIHKNVDKMTQKMSQTLLDLQKKAAQLDAEEQAAKEAEIESSLSEVSSLQAKIKGMEQLIAEQEKEKQQEQEAISVIDTVTKLTDKIAELEKKLAERDEKRKIKAKYTIPKREGITDSNLYWNGWDWIKV